jgi:hypothetical protein
MVTEVVVKESLSQQMIESGAKLTRQLDAEGMAVTASLWFYDTDANDWRFLIATADIRSEGVREIYKKVQSVVTAMPSDSSIALKDITVLDSDDPLISILRIGVRTGTGISCIRFSRNMINGTYIEDAYIYRLT